MLFTLDSIPAAFPALALAHFLALLSPGPDFFLVIGHAARRGLRGAFFICLGISFGNGAYILLASCGLSLLQKWPAFFRLLECTGILYLAWMGSMLIKASGL